MSPADTCDHQSSLFSSSPTHGISSRNHWIPSFDGDVTLNPHKSLLEQDLVPTTVPQHTPWASVLPKSKHLWRDDRPALLSTDTMMKVIKVCTLVSVCLGGSSDYTSSQCTSWGPLLSQIHTDIDSVRVVQDWSHTCTPSSLHLIFEPFVVSWPTWILCCF